MYRFILTAIFALFYATSAVAEFGPRAWGPSTKLIYVAPTDLKVYAAPAEQSNGVGNRSLCVKVQDHHALFVPYRRVVSGYVLSSTNCTSPEATTLTPAVITRLKGAGMVPAFVPDIPSAPLNILLRAQIVVMLFALALCALPWLMRRRLSPVSRKVRQVSGDPLYFDALLSLMFHVSRTDGVIEKAELQTIRTVYEDLTGSPVSAEMVASRFAKFTSDSSILGLVRQYRGAQAETLLDAAILVATDSGCIPREKKTFLTELNTALGCEKKWFDRSLAEALCPEARAAKLGRAAPQHA